MNISCIAGHCLAGSRNHIVLIATLASCVVFSSQVQAQWWSRAPADFEECADVAEKSPGKQARAAAVTERNAQVAGRRKTGGGYSYFDFMQNRNFDIEGPNPTQAEQKHIDEQYAIYLDDQRRSKISDAFGARQQQLQQAALKDESEKAPPPTPSIAKPAPKRSADIKRVKPAGCPEHSFSCEWPRLS